MKKSNVLQFRLSDADLFILQRIVDEFRIEFDSTYNKSDVFRYLIREKYQEFIDKGRIESNEMAGGVFAIFD